MLSLNNYAIFMEVGLDSVLSVLDFTFAFSSAKNVEEKEGEKMPTDRTQTQLWDELLSDHQTMST